MFTHRSVKRGLISTMPFLFESEVFSFSLEVPHAQIKLIGHSHSDI